MTSPDECWFCDDGGRDAGVRSDPPPGGWLLDDGPWRAGHTPAAFGPAGTVILESRRHVADQSDFDEEESRTLAPVTGRLVAAICDATGCDRVYQWATMDRFPHFHLWLVPWSEAAGLRGPRYLVAALGDTGGCSPTEAEAGAAAIRRALEARDAR